VELVEVVWVGEGGRSVVVWVGAVWGGVWWCDTVAAAAASPETQPSRPATPVPSRPRQLTGQAPHPALHRTTSHSRAATSLRPHSLSIIKQEEEEA
ncbi:hypothetical protein Pcinc_042198, partial [Petrolisthes cinctipes]